MRPFFMHYIQGDDRSQAALLPAAIEDYVAADAPVRVIDAFVDGLDVKGLRFGRSVPAATGRPPYDPRDLLKLYLYGYLSEVRSSRRLERECSRNVETMWLLRRLAPDFRTIADFRRDNGPAIVGACRGPAGDFSPEASTKSVGKQRSACWPTTSSAPSIWSELPRCGRDSPEQTKEAPENRSP